MKNYVCFYVNEGYDVVIIEQFQEVLLLYGGVFGVRIVLLFDFVCDKFDVKWLGINKVNNFEFICEGVKVWRVY